jgi:hypothetical protein
VVDVVAVADQLADQHAQPFAIQCVIPCAHLWSQRVAQRHIHHVAAHRAVRHWMFWHPA